MLNNIFETMSFIITAITFAYAALTIIKKNGYTYFKFYFGAISCYMIEEIWVLVNTCFGKSENMVSIRLVAIYGSFCFILSGARHLDEMVDKNHNADETASLVAIIMPLLLLSIYGCFLYNTFYSIVKITLFVVLFVLSPAFFTSYYNFKCLIMKKDCSVYLKDARIVNGLTLLFILSNFGYLLMQFVELKFVSVEILDFINTIIFALVIVFSKRSAKKWEAFQ